MSTTRPYFLENEEWYKFNEDEWKYELTDKAPEKARKSYEEFYKTEEVIDGEIYVINR